MQPNLDKLRLIPLALALMLASAGIANAQVDPNAGGEWGVCVADSCQSPPPKIQPTAAKQTATKIPEPSVAIGASVAVGLGLLRKKKRVTQEV